VELGNASRTHPNVHRCHTHIPDEDSNEDWQSKANAITITQGGNKNLASVTLELHTNTVAFQAPSWFVSLDTSHSCAAANVPAHSFSNTKVAAQRFSRAHIHHAALLWA